MHGFKVMKDTANRCLTKSILMPIWFLDEFTPETRTRCRGRTRPTHCGCQQSRLILTRIYVYVSGTS